MQTQAFGGDGYVYYHECGIGSYIYECTHQMSTLNICSLSQWCLIEAIENKYYIHIFVRMCMCIYSVYLIYCSAWHSRWPNVNLFYPLPCIS